MKSPFEYLADVIIKRPRLVAIIIIIGLFVSISGASLIENKTGPKTYLYIDQPVGSLLIHYSNEFSSNSIILIVEGADVTTPDVVQYLDKLQNTLSEQRYVRSASSYITLLKAYNGDVLPQNQADIDRIISELPADTMKSALPSDSMALVSVPLDTGLSSDTQTSIVKSFKSVIAFTQPPAGITVTVSGSPAFTADMADDMQKNLGVLLVVALVLMVVAVIVFFSNVRYRLLPVGIVFYSILLTFGFMGHARIAMTSVVVAAFPVLIGIGIDYAIQFHSRLDEEVRRRPLEDAVRIMITNSGPSILLALIATALGFVALSIFAASPMVGDFGVICIIGIIWCYIGAIIIVPTFALLTNYSAKSAGVSVEGQEKLNPMQKYDRAIGKFAGKISRCAVPVFLILSMVAAIGFVVDDKVIIDTDEKMMVSQDLPASVSMKKLESVLGSTSSITAYIKADNVYDPETIKWIDGFGEYTVDKNLELTGVTSIATLLRLANNGELPTTYEEINRAADRIPEQQKKVYISGKTETVMQFSLEAISIPKTQALIKTMDKDLKWYTAHPGLSAAFTGSMMMFTDMIDSIASTKNLMTYLAFVLITVFLFAVYRKITAIAPVVPIILVVYWNSLAMYLLGINYTLLTATIGAMSVGVASEYTILVMERYHEEIENGTPQETAISTAVSKIGSAITISGITTAFGFSALMMSTSPMIQNFGSTTVMSVVFSLLGGIIVMPAILEIFANIQNKYGAKKAQKDLL